MTITARHETISLIVPQHNQPLRTKTLLDQLRQCEPEPHEVVLVDDGSLLVDPFPWPSVSNQVRLRQPHSGVTAAWNHGARNASGDVLIFLNNDVGIEGPFLSPLRNELADPAVSLAGVNWRKERSLPLGLLESRQLPLVEGWCFAVRRADFDTLQGFDESMRLYFSDTDFQWRIRERFPERRFSVLPRLPLVHEGHATMRTLPERRPTWHRDRRRFVEKWTNR
ncbi:MAG TPA: glycosyltransferase [Planctomycetaceae bacterium]|nr:glycosyltransferase [Planctomycetaceae bacterium]